MTTLIYLCCVGLQRVLTVVLETAEIIRKARRLGIIVVIFSNFMVGVRWTTWRILPNGGPSYHTDTCSRSVLRTITQFWKTWHSLASNNLIFTRIKTIRHFWRPLHEFSKSFQFFLTSYVRRSPDMYTRLQTVWSLLGHSRQADKDHKPRCHRRPNGPGRLADTVVKPTTQFAEGRTSFEVLWPKGWGSHYRMVLI